MHLVALTLFQNLPNWTIYMSEFWKRKGLTPFWTRLWWSACNLKISPGSLKGLGSTVQSYLTIQKFNGLGRKSQSSVHAKNPKTQLVKSVIMGTAHSRGQHVLCMCEVAWVSTVMMQVPVISCISLLNTIPCPAVAVNIYRISTFKDVETVRE